MSSPQQQHFVGQQQLQAPQDIGAQNSFQQQLTNEEVRPENVALEFVSQSGIGAGVNAAADFFNNMRLGDEHLEGPGYTSSISAFNPLLWAEKMDGLRASSVQHASTLTTKQRWELEAIDMHNGVWRFNTEQRRATGLCGCGNNVVYPYPSLNTLKKCINSHKSMTTIR
jgi:hypothetical protein